MRWTLCVPVLAVATAAPAQDRPDDVVRVAVTAAGGADVLAKFPAGRVVGKGTMTFAGTETAFTFEQAYHVPARFRTVVRCEVKGQAWELLQVAHEAGAAQRVNGKPVPLTDADRREVQLAALVTEVGQLTPLTSDRKFTLKPDRQFKGPDAVGLLALVKGHPDLRLAFDRKTGHLVRIAHKSADPDTGKETETETTFTDFKEVSGLTRATRAVVTRDGKRVLDLTVERFTPLEKIDPRAFVTGE